MSKNEKRSAPVGRPAIGRGATGRSAAGRTPVSRAAPIQERPERSLGLRVKAYRKLRRQRLQDLALQAGCSESLLSRIENGLVSPSLSTLHRLSQALGVNVAALLEPAIDVPCAIYKPQDRPNTSLSGAVEGDGSSAQSLIPYADGRRLEALIVELPIDGKLCGPFTHEGEEVGLVLEGALELTVDGVIHQVAEQSSFFLLSYRPHSYRAIGDRPCRVIWINTPPSF